ncbi:hypothetical protein ABTX80_31480 [Streptomyces erythrochromogenes]|uniref:hypothetical protein n=1 Tax=Streptomyces erythrochromogenes TaxID=285574 RepID=UPI003332A82B
MPLHLTRRLIPLTLATTAALGGLSLASAHAASRPEAAPTAVAQAPADVYPQPDRDKGHTTRRAYTYGHVYTGHCYDGKCGPIPIPWHLKTHEKPPQSEQSAAAEAVGRAEERVTADAGASQ